MSIETTKVHKQLDTDAESALELLRNLEHHSRVQAPSKQSGTETSGLLWRSGVTQVLGYQGCRLSSPSCPEPPILARGMPRGPRFSHVHSVIAWHRGDFAGCGVLSELVLACGHGQKRQLAGGGAVPGSFNPVQVKLDSVTMWNQVHCSGDPMSDESGISDEHSTVTEGHN